MCSENNRVTPKNNKKPIFELVGKGGLRALPSTLSVVFLFTANVTLNFNRNDNEYHRNRLQLIEPSASDISPFQHTLRISPYSFPSQRHRVHLAGSMRHVLMFFKSSTLPCTHCAFPPPATLHPPPPCRNMPGRCLCYC